MIHPSGESMYVANEGSDSVVRFRIDEATGRLHLEGAVIQTGSPVCIVFRPAAKAA